MVIIAKNKKARYLYHIRSTFDVGIQLHGTEVKSLRAGHVNIGDSYAESYEGEIWLINSYISEYSNAPKNFQHEPMRNRRLLLRKREISRISGMINKEGMTLIPLKFYFNKSGIAKIELALGHGKKLYDKREDKKQKDWNRQKQRLLKNS